jgi:hypothetical protein
VNPLSAFSFGQLIKTFLPGLIASASPLLILEAAYQWRQASAPATCWDLLEQSFLRLMSSNLASSITLLVLAALLLGFSINSVHWVWFHKFCRKRCTSPELEKAQEALRRIAERALEKVLPGPDPRPTASVQGFFLPQIDLAKYAHLRESYFAWYEFHMNSLVALGVVLVTFIGVSAALSVHWRIAWRSEGILILLVTGFCVAAMVFLWRAALLNLKTYEERSFWFLVGTLYWMRTADEGRESEEAGDPGWLRWAAPLLLRLFR